jgi:hypothetical protein
LAKSLAARRRRPLQPDRLFAGFAPAFFLRATYYRARALDNFGLAVFFFVDFVVVDFVFAGLAVARTFFAFDEGKDFANF